MNDFLKIIAAGGGGAAVAFGIFAALGKRWLEHVFAQKLERFRHEQAKEIEHVRYEINSLFSRVSKIHEREFEVLPTAWKLLHESHGRVSRICSPLPRLYPDLSRMEDNDLSEFLAWMTKLPDSRKQEIQQAAARDRNKIYLKALEPLELGEAKEHQREFHNYLILNRFFMTDELWEKFSNIDKQLNNALNAFEIGKQAKDQRLIAESVQSVTSVETAFD